MGAVRMGRRLILMRFRRRGRRFDQTVRVNDERAERQCRAGGTVDLKTVGWKSWGIQAPRASVPTLLDAASCCDGDAAGIESCCVELQTSDYDPVSAFASKGACIVHSSRIRTMAWEMTLYDRLLTLDVLYSLLAIPRFEQPPPASVLPTPHQKHSY